MSNAGSGERVRIVTGAASGIGKATAERMAQSGCGLLLCDIDQAGVQATAAAIGPQATAVVADVSSADDCAAVVRAAARLGRLGALINVAGVMATVDTVETVSEEDIERILAVNLKAIFRLGRHAIPELRAGGGGTIVNVSSVHAFATMTSAAAYAASKGAVTALTRSMAIDLAPDGIRVLAVAPGAIDTPLSRADLARRGLTLEEAGFPSGEHAIGRLAAPEEVAEVIVWLCSDSASLLNGCTVVADAGLLARLI
jgi:NAD(P)-dependent dehydrogenase (short-subunit alcohol dehydrogenase family)